MSIDLTRHPCFNEAARHTFGRLHLPVARECNVQCKFCDRKYDCPNESRPGVTSACLSPGQALWYLQRMLAETPNIAVVGIAGPGDPFARPEVTMETLARVRAAYPEMMLCVASNGLNISPFAKELGTLGVSHVTITINAVDPAIAGKIYAWVRYEGRPYRNVQAGEIMIAHQFEAVRQLKQHGVTVKINTIVIPGINDEHVLEVSRRVAAEGADMQNLIGLYSVPGTFFEHVVPPEPDRMAALRLEARAYLPQMSHCQRCRADAVGLLHQGTSAEALSLLGQAAAAPLEPQHNRPYVAVASLEGVLVNQHLGQADEFFIFRPHTGGGFEEVEVRRGPAPGVGAQRWTQLADVLHDCRAVLCCQAGQPPREALEKQGIAVVLTEGLIEQGLQAVYSGQSVRMGVRPACHCSGRGDGTGCG